MIFLACSGKEITLCTSPYLLVCLRRLTFFLQLRTWWIGFSKKQYDVSFLLHYLDDFHTLGPPNSQMCQRNVDTSIQQFQDWGIPLHHDKLESPSTILTVLGIELYCLLLHARLAQEKFDCIHTLLVTKTPLHTEGAGVFNWQSSTCMQSRPFWSHLPPPYDQSAFTFLQREPSYKA